jgi:hypothetical protein
MVREYVNPRRDGFVVVEKLAVVIDGPESRTIDVINSTNGAA